MSMVLDRDGLRLAFHDGGGQGTPVLLQHGLGGAVGQIRDYVGGRPGLRPLTLECRGHGSSEAGDAAGFSIATFADDVAAAFDRFGPSGPLVIGGVSMGAAIALRLAVTRPERVSALVLIRPAWLVDPAPANMAPNAEVGRLLADRDPAEARRVFEAGATARRLVVQAPDNLVSLLGFFTREPLAVTSELLTRISADGPGVTADDVRAIAVPTLVIGNARDAVHPLAHAEGLAALIPGAVFKQVTAKADDKARHASEVGAAVEAFVQHITEGTPSP